jgi:hypothetical protein
MSDTVQLPDTDVLAIDASVISSTDSASYGLTPSGFLPKPFGRLLAEKMALARGIFGDSLDLGSGSVIRKLLELTALEDARTWSALASMYDDCFVSSATGEALSRLGSELGLVRPFLEATGTVKLKLTGKLPQGVSSINIPRGARMSTAGGHHVATAESVVLSPSNPQRDVNVVAFYPGPTHNLDPSKAVNNTFPQKIDRWNRLDPLVKELDDAERAANAVLVEIQHAQPLTGGETQWADARYRDLLLNAPRSVWTVEAIEMAVSMVPGVRLAQVRDAQGGLDINESIFGNFNFIDRMFGTERDLGSPYYFTVLIAPTPAAIWDGPDGLSASVQGAIDHLRPIGIFPRIQQAAQINIGVSGKLVVQGLPLPTGSVATVNASSAAVNLKARITARLRRYVDGLKFGEPVRASEVIWTIMNEPGLADVQDLALLRYPASFDTVPFAGPVATFVQAIIGGQNVQPQSNQIASLIDDPSGLTII